MQGTMTQVRARCYPKIMMMIMILMMIATIINDDDCHNNDDDYDDDNDDEEIRWTEFVVSFELCKRALRE